MKKLITLGLTVASVALLGACGDTGSTEKDSATSSSSATTVESTVKEEAPVVEDKFAGQEEKGEGTFNIANQSGNTEEGDSITVFYDPNTFPTDLGVSTWDLDGSMLSYIYADGQLVDTLQLGNSQNGVELQDVESAITEGDHKLQLVQYADDNEDGEIVTYKEQPYTVKLK